MGVSLRLPLLLAATGLAGCASSGSVPVAVAVAPPPVPAPPPAPTPTPPPPTISPFPASSSTYFTTVHVEVRAEVRLEALPNDRRRIADLLAITSGASGLGNFHYIAPDSYEVEFGGFGGPRFTPADLEGRSDQFERFRTSHVQGFSNTLALAVKAPGSLFTYASFGNVAELGSSTATLTFFAVGATTPTSGMPRTGVASYVGIADGLWVDNGTTRRLYGSPARLAADFDNARVTATLELSGHADPFGAFAQTPRTPLGRFEGTGSIGHSANFAGAFTASAGYNGEFQGHFFGPRADEAGFSFDLTGGPGQRAFGAAAVTQAGRGSAPSARRR